MMDIECPTAARPRGELIYVIFQHLRAYPDYFVVSSFDYQDHHGGYMPAYFHRLYATLSAAREGIRRLDKGLTRIGRGRRNDPCVVEAWV